MPNPKPTHRRQEPDWPLPTKGGGYAKIYKVCVFSRSMYTRRPPFSPIQYYAWLPHPVINGLTWLESF